MSIEKDQIGSRKRPSKYLTNGKSERASTSQLWTNPEPNRAQPEEPTTSRSVREVKTKSLLTKKSTKKIWPGRQRKVFLQPRKTTLRKTSLRSSSAKVAGTRWATRSPGILAVKNAEPTTSATTASMTSRKSTKHKSKKKWRGRKVATTLTDQTKTKSRSSPSPWDIQTAFTAGPSEPWPTCKFWKLNLLPTLFYLVVPSQWSRSALHHQSRANKGFQ